MTSAADFTRAIRSGGRQGTATVVAHYWCCDSDGAPPRVGFAVSKAVGNSVVRHRVTRQLRHVVRPRLAELPAGSLLVLRATPSAAGASSPELAIDVARALDRVRGGRAVRSRG
jgi:ribonuclease P protein component